MGNTPVTRLFSLCPVDLFEDGPFDEVYEVDEQKCIGAGKFSTVHLCWLRSQPERRYALKVINTKVGDTASLNRIQEEIHIMQELGSQPGIVSLVDVDDSVPNCIRLVLELCEGGELYDRIQQKQYYPEQEAKVTCRQLLKAVCYIHGKGIMHRDLKPENILLASKVSNTDIKISDMGLAKISKDWPRRLPRSSSICGSDFYLAPEVIKQEEYGREIDIWAVGVISYVLLSGSLPFFHNVLHKLYRQIVERDISFPEQAWRHVSKGALDFILRLLQVRPGDRLTAEQAITHPWLRSADATSFSSQDMSRTNSLKNWGAMVGIGGGETPQLQPTQSAVVHPLEHAHKVGNDPVTPSRPSKQNGAVTPTVAGPPQASRTFSMQMQQQMGPRGSRTPPVGGYRA
mmetsp:Transcript_59478/g.141663  ORF Transcript_59478/g.141663 Transcript_59478/m.141663 type:complete len:401 (-) Transcript_59478:199-1401(-)|eukprot:CAMPEP_0178430728 /NCGR_PEP_ID=MMETSP0689_2-20121128/31471_1 /TAXON_ID=160604 /ORGANISM="Amphidinium massartii, Strain CS-259" /LENGTH=400 /DNA_ID=CAMNT_0020052597 /DNA_START=101 /DNA_END=1303 /DNA_ORIENTATION=-